MRAAEGVLAGSILERVNMSSVFTYYRLELQLIEEMYGTCAEAEIWSKHVLEKAKKEIKQANILTKKVSKQLDKFKGDEIEPSKEVFELKGILRSFMELSGVTYDLPDDKELLLEVAKQVREDVEAIVGKSKAPRTVFMRDEKGNVILSSHMILGNVKEILKIITNVSTDKDAAILKSKVAVGESGALDLKVVERSIKASTDIIRDAEGKPDFVGSERIIGFTVMGEKQTCIAMSERLPIGTLFSMNLRVRTASPLAKEETLKFIFTHGLNLGLGQWRGSGGKGAYCFKLIKCGDEFKDTRIPEGWNV